MPRFRIYSVARVSVMLALLLISPTASKAAGTGCLPAILKIRLAQIEAKFGKVRVISTHRRGARIAGSGRRSYHASCRAVDFAAPRGKYKAVVSWLKANHGGGVGTYSCGMHHIHVDNGPQVRFHHCVTAKGRPIRAGRRASRPMALGRKTRAANRVRATNAPVVLARPKGFKAPRFFGRATVNGN